ncbi:MAG: hypothetical protein JWM14_3415 [Chitinophagaceae bacterium]|nr:hypothetical protein [Chitinophagaceae bacterium]
MPLSRGTTRYRITNSDWNYFTEIEFFFDSFSLYADQVNQFVDSEIASAKDKYESYSKEIEANPSSDIEGFDHFSNVRAKVGLTDIYYDSLIMTLYSFIEKKMFFLSKHLGQVEEIKVNDIEGNGIFKYQKYLSKVCKIDFLEIDQEWKMFIGFNKLRNQIVHSEGTRSIQKSNIELITFLKNINGVELNNEGETMSYHFRTNEIVKIFSNVAKKITDHLYIE